jgi:hypothetical protein
LHYFVSPPLQAISEACAQVVVELTALLASLACRPLQELPLCSNFDRVSRTGPGACADIPPLQSFDFGAAEAIIGNIRHALMGFLQAVIHDASQAREASLHAADPNPEQFHSSAASSLPAPWSTSSSTTRQASLAPSSSTPWSVQAPRVALRAANTFRPNTYTPTSSPCVTSCLCCNRRLLRGSRCFALDGASMHFLCFACHRQLGR